MKHIIKRSLETRLSKPVVGCAIQGDRFLAMSVSGEKTSWNIHWCLAGTLGNKERMAQLRELVDRSPFWVTPRKEGAAQRDFAFAVDIPEGFARNERERAEALRTQVATRFANVAEEIEAGGVEAQGPDGRHLVGFGAVRPSVEADLRFWRRECRIRSPHIAAPAAAIANLYLQCRGIPASGKSRIVIVIGDETTTAVVLKGWRLIDAVDYRMVEGQTLDKVLVSGWVDYVRKRHPDEKDLDPLPIVLDASDDPSAWNPFSAEPSCDPDPADPGIARPAFIRAPAELVRHSAASVGEGRQDPYSATREVLSGAMGYAAIAFGMALQGGN